MKHPVPWSIRSVEGGLMKHPLPWSIRSVEDGLMKHPLPWSIRSVDDKKESIFELSNRKSRQNTTEQNEI